jgi:cyclopropane-fatty-acyl-phospholipid synthase
VWLLDKMLRKGIKRGQLIIIGHDGTQHRYGVPDATFPRSVVVKLSDPRVALQIAKNPRLAAGEAYMDNRLMMIEGDIRDLALLLTYNAPRTGGAWASSADAIGRAARAVSGQLDQVNWRKRSRRNAEHSYNLTRQLYELFLDEDRQYTCAYYRDPANSLEQAQLDKKAHIAAKLYLKPGMRVLDIGCGWGGLALYLHRHYDVDVIGVSLAPDQIAFCRDRAEAAGVSHRVKFELQDYRDVEGQFDRVVNVGLIEHLGTPHYPGFYGKCRDLLVPDGVMVSHCCGRMSAAAVTDQWTRKYIFPGGAIPTLSALLAKAERQELFVSDVEVLRLHYAYTLHEWYRRANAARERIVALYDERFFRMWQFYLAGAEAGFRYAGLVNFQVQYLKQPDSVPIVRDHMASEEERLRASDTAPEWSWAPALQAAE